MKKTLAILLLVAAAPAFAAPVLAAPSGAKPAGSRDGNAPINISSDSFQADLNGKTGTWTGNVIVIQGDVKMRSNQVRVSTVSGKPDKVLATGNVVVDSPASGTITGDNGAYSIGPRTVVMTGNVTMKKGRDVMRGAQLTVNMVTGQATLGGGVKTGIPGSPNQGGRVQAVILPNGN